VPSSCAPLGGLDIGARVALLWQHSGNTKCQRVLVVALCLVTFCVSRRRRKMYCGHARLSVCLSAAACPHYCTDPGVTWGSGTGRECHLVVHCWADLQSVHGLRCYGNIMRALVTSLRPSCDMTTYCERSAGSARAAGR